MPPQYAIFKSVAMLLVAVAVAAAADDSDDGLKDGAASAVDFSVRWWSKRPTAEAEIAAAEWER